MNAIIRTMGAVLRGVLKLFVDDGVYAAVTIVWITGVIEIGSQQPTIRAHQGLILAIGLDLIFAVSVISRIRAARLRRAR